MNTFGLDLMGRRRRRRHSAEFKAAVIKECMRPGVSIAAVALAHSLNANMLRKWLILADRLRTSQGGGAPARSSQMPEGERGAAAATGEPSTTLLGNDRVATHGR